MEFQLAWRNLWRQPRRTWLTTGAMVFCNVILVFLVSLQLGMYQLMIDSSLRPFVGHLQVQHEDFLEGQKLRQVVPAAATVAADLRSNLQLETVSARGQAFGLASSEERSYGVAVVGVDPLFEPGVSSLPGLVRQGRYLESFDAQEAVVGALLAHNLRVGLGEEITILGSGRDGSFAAGVLTIVGFFESGISDLDRSALHIPLGAFQEIFAMESAGHSVVVTAPSLFEVDIVKQRVEQTIPSGGDLAVRDWNALEPGLRQAIQSDIASAWFMYAVLIVLVAFSVLNTQLMSVLERTKEFGVVMALGITPSRLGRVVLLETTLMGVIGAVLGMVLGVALLLAIGRTGIPLGSIEELAAQYNLPSVIYPRFSWIGLVAGPLMVMMGSICAALYPAFRLRRLEPVDAMRSA